MTAILLVEWFRDNYMTLNASKCHLLVSGFKDELMCAAVGVHMEKTFCKITWNH